MIRTGTSNMTDHSLDVWQRLTCKFKDIRGSADKNQQKLRELVASDSASQGEEPLPQDEEDEQYLVKSQDPVVGTYGRQHQVNVL